MTDMQKWRTLLTIPPPNPNPNILYLNIDYVPGCTHIDGDGVECINITNIFVNTQQNELMKYLHSLLPLYEPQAIAVFLDHSAIGGNLPIQESIDRTHAKHQLPIGCLFPSYRYRCGFCRQFPWSGCHGLYLHPSLGRLRSTSKTYTG